MRKLIKIYDGNRVMARREEEEGRGGGGEKGIVTIVR